MTEVRWTRLTAIELEPWFTKKLKSSAEAFNVRIAKLLQSREQTVRMLGKIESTDTAEIDFVNLVSYPTHVEGVTKDLQVELLLRRDMVSFFDDHHAELEQQREKAAAEHLQIQERVRGELLAIGYVDAPLSALIVGKITPVFLASHPQVHAARGLADSFASRCSSGEPAKLENRKAIDQVEQQLDYFRERAMGQLGPAKNLPPARPGLGRTVG